MRLLTCASYILSLYGTYVELYVVMVCQSVSKQWMYSPNILKSYGSYVEWQVGNGLSI